METENKARVKVQRQKVAPEIQLQLRDMASELRQPMYGEAEYPEWGTLFQKIEDDISQGVRGGRSGQTRLAGQLMPSLQGC